MARIVWSSIENSVDEKVVVRHIPVRFGNTSRAPSVWLAPQRQATVQRVTTTFSSTEFSIELQTIRAVSFAKTSYTDRQYARTNIDNFQKLMDKKSFATTFAHLLSVYKEGTIILFAKSHYIAILLLARWQFLFDETQKLANLYLFKYLQSSFFVFRSFSYFWSFTAFTKKKWWIFAKPTCSIAFSWPKVLL